MSYNITGNEEYLKKITDVTDFKRTYRTVQTGEFPADLSLVMQKEFDLRYGENPNQPAAVYRMKNIDIAGLTIAELTNIRLAKSGKGGLSATNLMDVARALDIHKFFSARSVAVMKHLIPSGFATQYIYDITNSGATHSDTTLAELYRKARDADARSAFGSIVVLNSPVDKDTAGALLESYVEGVAAPDYEEGAIGIIEAKKDMRVILFSNIVRIPKFIDDDVRGIYDMKVLPTGRVVVQKPYLSSIKGPESLIYHPKVASMNDVEHIVNRTPNEYEINDMLTAWYVNIGTRSNGIVIVKDGITLAVGSGQQERVIAVEQAIIKAYQKAMARESIEYDPINGAAARNSLRENPLAGAVASSDAFFPFRDSIDLMAKNGIRAVIQPGGSLRDPEVIDAVNEHDMAMPYTLERCFAHF